ncbi:MAG: hypothetical protein R3B68_13460 [Phycisphaerales bacterium]
MTSRRARHARILRLLGKGPVPSHEALRQLLAQQGVEATQATISRDLRELGAVKSPAGYTLSAQHAPAAPLDAALPAYGAHAAVRAFVTSVGHSPLMVVLHTAPAHASLVAAELDRDPPEGVLGTIAGDDTIFIACRSEQATRRLAADLADAAGINTAAHSPASHGRGNH